MTKYQVEVSAMENVNFLRNKTNKEVKRCEIFGCENYQIKKVILQDNLRVINIL